MPLTPEKKIWFTTICRKNNIGITDTQLTTLEQLVDILLDWNLKVNLISRKDVENVWERHVLGSLSFLSKFDLIRETNIADVGTGGGFPGLPLAILYPDCEFILIDSIQKKIKVVQEIITGLGLTNVIAVCERAEKLSSEERFQGLFDYVFARAVAPVNDIVKWTKPFLSEEITEPSTPAEKGKTFLPCGSIVLLKGGDITVEVSEATIKSKLKSVETFPIILDGLDSEILSDKKILLIKP